MNSWSKTVLRQDTPTQRHQMLWRALQKVQQGDLQGAQSLLDDNPGQGLSIGEVFRLHHEELQTQAQQLRDTQQQAEQALGWFARLFRQLPVAAVMVDARGLVVDANQQARHDLALAALERGAPVPLRRLLAEADDELRLAHALAHALADEQAHALTHALAHEQAHEQDHGWVGLDLLALRGPGGTRRTVDLRITQLPPREPGAGQPGAEQARALCVIHDRTAQIDAQQARDAALLAERAREVAEATSRMQTTMMSRLSHELRTPLNAVLGFSQLLLDGSEPLSAQQRQRMALIQDAGRNLLALVDDVLLINGLGGSKLKLQPVPLQAVVCDVLALQQLQIEQRALRLQAPTLVAGLPTTDAQADPRRVREILLNLVSNAIKYNRHGGNLQVHCHADGPWAIVEVRDTGIGLTPLQQAHLFEPFNRLGAENSAVEGTGLGLNIAQSLAQAMDGEIRVQSEPGIGSCFSLVLPLAPPPAAPPPPVAAGAQRPDAANG